MPHWRTSTWLFLLACAAALVAEVIYATSADSVTQSHQGHALGLLLILAVVFAFYRALTRPRD